jgi:hypothetical protein
VARTTGVDPACNRWTGGGNRQIATCAISVVPGCSRTYGHRIHLEVTTFKPARDFTAATTFGCAKLRPPESQSRAEDFTAVGRREIHSPDEDFTAIVRDSTAARKSTILAKSMVCKSYPEEFSALL